MRMLLVRRVFLSVLLVLCMAAVVPAGAQSVPVVINFQGRLYDPSAGGGTGGPLMGIQQVEFRIYDNLTGGTLIWGRMFPVYCNAEGVFNVLLNDEGTSLGGSAASLADTFAGANRFLELTVQGHGTAMAPRQQIVSAPYAFHAKSATSAEGATGGFTVNGGLQVQSGGAQVSSGRLTANQGLTASGGAVISGGLTNQGGAVLSGGATVSNGLTVAGGATLAGNVAVNSGTLTVNNGALTANQGLTVNHGMTCNGDYATFNSLIIGYGGAEIQHSFRAAAPAQMDEGVTVYNKATVFGGLDAYGQINIYGAKQTLTKGAALSSDGFVFFFNRGDLDVTIGGWNIKGDNMGAITIPGFKGQVVTWNNCEEGAFFFPLNR